MFRFAAILAVIVSLGGLMGPAQAGEKHKVVYHVSEIDKVGFALGNIANHIKGVGGPENVEIVLVAHGPALKSFHEMQASAQVMSRVEALQEDGVRFEACGNTMNAQAVSLSDLLSDFVRRDEGGVVRIAQLQSEGYLYIRP
ncbi:MULTISPECIES: DsrE family protein [Sediminimonas]|uniref:DsrE family protein n=1 Tax=Sediminimonas TaxID=659427 RepID=UPI0004193875|nr:MULTISPECIES: DsrE family protein [Sediminimonas]MDR9485721.1 DsrE family protein [Sediminimonas sp.]